IAIRQGPWKLVKIGDQTFELYNLDYDLGENKNLADEQVEIVENLWDKYLTWDKDIKVSALKWEN
ncbi:MAG: arylsulfatase, partial [Cyclobacteriaceae bacterium]|nr:arylsulfatase [Cyclobacteriaceae bacterium]